MKKSEMNHYLDLIPIYARAHRKLSQKARICIMLSVFLAAVLFGLADMYLRGVTKKQMLEEGNWHYSLSSINEETAACISAYPQVAASGFHAGCPSDTGFRLASTPVSLSGQEEPVFTDILLCSIQEGAYPAAVDQIALSSDFKHRLQVGDSLLLTLPDNTVQRFTISGFFEKEESRRLTSESGSTVVLSLEGIRALASLGMQEQYLIQLSHLCDMDAVVSDMAKQLSLEAGQVTANEPLLSILGQLKGGGVSQIYQVAFLLSLIVMATCVLMISGSLNGDVLLRTRFFGLLRCLGATPSQIRRYVTLESLRQCKTAIPAGLLLSFFIVWILSAVMRAFSPYWFSYMPRFGISLPAVAAGSMLGLICVLLSSHAPAKMAAKSSALEAVTGSRPAVSARRPPSASRPHPSSGSRMFSSDLPIEVWLGFQHALIKKKRFLLTSGAFAICVVLFLTFGVLVEFMNHAFTPSPWTPDLSVASEDNSCSIDQSLLEELKLNSRIKRAYGRMFAYDLSFSAQGMEGHANLISFDAYQFSLAKSSLTEGSIRPAAREPGQVLIVAQPSFPIRLLEDIRLTIGEKTHTVTVSGILSDHPLAREEDSLTIFCSEETFRQLTGEDGYTILDITFRRGISQEEVDAVKALFPAGSVFQDQALRMQQQRNLASAFAVLIYGFLSIIAAITAFHIQNTISMSVTARLSQYAKFKAIGMSSRQLLCMVSAEAASYAAAGCLFGCLIGLPAHWVIFTSLITTFWGIPWSVPWAMLFFILGLVIASVFFTVCSQAARLFRL